MSVSTLKRKADNENCRFKPAWDEKYLFILASDPKAKWMCLICDDCTAILKEFNVWRHHFE